MELQLVPNNDLDSSFVFSIGDYDGDQNSKYFVYNEKNMNLISTNLSKFHVIFINTKMYTRIYQK